MYKRQGNYSSYLKQREDNLEQMRAKRAAQERDIAHMQVFVDKFRYKPTKAAQAQAVSYTHLDVYKRQTDPRQMQGDLSVRPFASVLGGLGFGLCAMDVQLGL